ncbi:MAG: hypothetical protein COA78_02325 [Blastopirellula sp.]|nr:MAG: hypothetical protein COA78_02325 [Blastopirellula sp.]
MAFGHTDDVPNTFDPEAEPTPESSSLPPKVKVSSQMDLTPIYIKKSHNFKTDTFGPPMQGGFF